MTSTQTIRVFLAVILALAPFGPLCAKHFDEARFQKHAARYGNKAANLMELQFIVRGLNTKDPSVHFDVPPFFAISHADIKEYLDMVGVELDRTSASR